MEDTLSMFRYYKGLSERALEQVPDDKLTASLDDEANSIAVTMKHLAGNMRSRWTDFLTTDGEKPNRARDTEFEDPAPTRKALMQSWDDAWKILFAALEPLSDGDLSRTVMIRNEPHSVMQAIQRNLCHCAYHTAQIVLLAKHFAGEGWKPLTLPKAKRAQS
jgi:uncharacterized damage-inducible protein DinB